MDVVCCNTIAAANVGRRAEGVAAVALYRSNEEGYLLFAAPLSVIAAAAADAPQHVAGRRAARGRGEKRRTVVLRPACSSKKCVGCKC